MRPAPASLLLRNIKIVTGPVHFSQVLLVGVERTNAAHSAYLRELLEQLRPSAVLTAVEPDLPVFISAKCDYAKEYRRFVAEGGAGARFFVRADPTAPAHVTLSPRQLQQVVGENLSQGRYRRGSLFITEADPHSEREEVNGLLTPLLWAQQHADSAGPVLLAGYPYLLWLDITARTLPAAELARLLASLGKPAEALGKLRGALEANFGRVNDIRCLYMTEMAFAASAAYPKMLFVVETHLAEMLHRFLRTFSEEKAVGLSTLLNARQSMSYAVDFNQYMRKLVYLDCAAKHLVERFFRPAGRFPFPVDERVRGGQQGVNFYEELWDFYLGEARRALGALYTAPSDRAS